VLVNDTPMWPASAAAGWLPVCDLGEDVVDREHDRVGRLGVAQRADGRAQEVGQLDLEQHSGVGGVEVPVNLVETLTHVGARSHHVRDDHPAAGAADARHLGDRPLRVREVMQSAAADDQVERRIHEGQRRGIALLEEDVRDAGLAQAVGAELQQRPRQVEPDDLTDMRRELLGHVGCAAGDVQHDHVGVERVDPRQRRLRTPRER
jgi:hypothetical protein